MKAQRWRLRVLRVSNPYLQISPKTRTLYLWTKSETKFSFELQVEYQSRKIGYGEST